MKIKINIEKKHLYFLSALILVVGIGIVIAAPPWSENLPFHNTLYTNTIHAKDGNSVTVDNDLILKTLLTTTKIKSSTGKVTVDDDLEVTGEIINDKIGNFEVIGPKECKEESERNSNPCDTGVSVENSICFLTKVDLANIDRDAPNYERARCNVYKSGGTWRIDASADDDASAYCSATCLTW